MYMYILNTDSLKQFSFLSVLRDEVMVCEFFRPYFLPLRMIGKDNCFLESKSKLFFLLVIVLQILHCIVCMYIFSTISKTIFLLEGTKR